MKMRDPERELAAAKVCRLQEAVRAYEFQIRHVLYDETATMERRQYAEQWSRNSFEALQPGDMDGQIEETAP